LKLYKLKKQELIEYCNSIGIVTTGKTKAVLLEDAAEYKRKEIFDSKKNGSDKELLFQKISELANEYSSNLNKKIEDRKEEMKHDDNAHYLIYRVLGISNSDGQLIDEYQNTGRFLYKYAGSFLEEAAVLCFKFNNQKGGRTLVKNNVSSKPKTFEIDFLDGKNAIEIKWRDATTDGDHITKEHTRVKAIKSSGYVPIRVMFYYPQREQAKRVQETLKTIYLGVNGQYYGGKDAWNFIKVYTGYDLQKILMLIADKRTP